MYGLRMTVVEVVDFAAEEAAAVDTYREEEAEGQGSSTKVE